MNRVPLACAVAMAITSTHAVAAGPAAEAVLSPTQGSAVAGTVVFTQDGARVKVVANVTGLSPGGHGFHVHEKGDCSAPDATSAGGHFNPTGAPHGDPHKGPHHAGDMPMLMADAGGKAQLATELGGMSVAAGLNSVVGRAVIVHVNPDDHTTQPTGNAGGRAACGVIKAR